MLEQNKDEIMDTNKATPQEIFEMLEQQKKLQDIRAKLVGVLDKVNQTINSITVENLELTSSQIDNLGEKPEENEKKPVTQFSIVQEEMQAEEINKQLINLELKFSHYEVEGEETEFDF